LGRYNEAGLLIYKQVLANTAGGNFDVRAQRLKMITSQLHNHSDLAHVKGKTGYFDVLFCLSKNTALNQSSLNLTLLFYVMIEFNVKILSSQNTILFFLF
jgi:hypothetical protein